MNSTSDEEIIKESLHRSIANIEDFDNLRDFGPHGMPRDGILVIKRFTRNGNDSGFLITLNGSAFANQPDAAPKGVIAFDENRVHEQVQRCRSTWMDAVVHWQRRRPLLFKFGPLEHPFQERVQNEPALLREAAPALARAGAELFKVLFDDGDTRLKEIGRRLREASARSPLTITCYANHFFIPWGLLYTCPDGKAFPAEGEADPNGFWGYRHVIEHSVDRFPPTTGLATVNGKLRLGYNYDSRLLRQVKKQLAAFGARSELELVPRTRWSELVQAFQSQPYPDGLSHFYVHCHGSGPQLQAQYVPPRFEIDQRPVTAADLSAWIRGKLSPMPFFLLSACEGGQMNTLFYATFARELLERDAQGIVGPQIDIPMVLATRYAERFVELLLSSERPPKRVGEIVRMLTQEFWDQAHNPLGLVYSLYRGADSFVECHGASH